jgi:hypothetical protein
VNRAPGTIWTLRKDLNPPWITTTDFDQIRLVFDQGVSVCLSRKDARLLAKRLNQCLDETAKKR